MQPPNPAAQNSSVRRPLRTEVLRTWNLAWPVFLMHLVTIGVSTIDVIMVGSASTDELSYLGIGRVMLWMAVVISSGLLTGVTVFSARADGEGQKQDAGRIYAQGLVYTAAMTVFWMAALIGLGEPMLKALQMPPDLVVEGGEYILITAAGLPFYMYVLCTFLWLEGISRPRPGLYVMLTLLPINTFLNWLFIEGHLGAPALGASGAALATSLAQAVGAGLIFFYIRFMPDRDAWGLPAPLKGAWTAGKTMRRFGYAPGFATGMEYLGFNALTIMTGYLGAVVVGAYQVAFSLHAISFAVAMGFASATSVRVGNAMGRNDPLAVGFQVRLSAVLTALAMLPFALSYLVAGNVISGWFGVEAAVQITAAMLIGIIAPFLIFDGLQYMLVFALRAAGDEMFASLLQVGSFMVVMAGSGALLTFPLGLGAPGVAWGMAAGILCAAILLWARFIVIEKRLKSGAQ